jgi:hypothetical protein
MLMALLISSRVALMLLTTHWLMLGSFKLLGFPTEAVSGFTAIHTLLLVAGVGTMLFWFRGSPEVRRRFSNPPESWFKYSVPIGLAAIFSSFGGLLLYTRGFLSEASWAMGLSAVVGLCEIWALLGFTFGRPAA